MTDVSGIRLDRTRGGCFQKGLTEMKPSLGGRFCDALFLLFSESRTVCTELYARVRIKKQMHSLAYNSAQAVRPSEKQQRHRKTARPISLTFLSEALLEAAHPNPIQSNTGNYVFEMGG